MIVQGLFLYLWGGGETLSCLPPPQALLLNNLVRIFKRLEKKFVYSSDILEIVLHLYSNMQMGSSHGANLSQSGKCWRMERWRNGIR